MAVHVGIIMGSQSDWPTMKAAAEILDELGIAYEAKIVSAATRSLVPADAQVFTVVGTSDTPAWYDETVRSKKFVSSCTSWSSMKPNGFLEPY